MSESVDRHGLRSRVHARDSAQGRAPHYQYTDIWGVR